MFHLSIDNQRPAFILIPEPLGGWKKVKKVTKLGEVKIIPSDVTGWKTML